MNDKEITVTDLDESLSFEQVAEIVGVRTSVISVLIRNGILETIENSSEEVKLPYHAVLRLRKMMRLRRDLRVNFAGAEIILNLTEEIRSIRRQLSELQEK